MQQIEIIGNNFTSGRKISHEIQEAGLAMEQKLRQLLISPPLTHDNCPLEEQLDHNWEINVDPDNQSIPDLFELFAYMETRGYANSPSLQMKSKHKYARYDVVKHPRMLEFITALEKIVKERFPDSNYLSSFRMMVLRSGAGIFPDILEILDNEGRKHIKSPQNENFLIQMATESPYFEAGKAINARRPINALESDTLTFFPPTLEGLSSPSVSIISTESRSPHLQIVARALDEGGIFCYYVEPIGNNPSMDVPDLRKLIETIKAAPRKSQDVQKVFIVIDTSIMGGKFDLSKYVNTEALQNINIVIIESANKYLSYGTNKANLGFTYGLGPDIKWLFDSLESKNQMSGQSDIRSVLTFPLPNSKIVQERQKRFNDNAIFIAQQLEKIFKGKKAQITHPSLNKHQQHKRAQTEYNFQGSILFVELPESAYDKVDELLQRSDIIESGTSYGFNKTRAEIIHKKDENGTKKPLGLRISVGTENIRELILVLEELQSIISHALTSISITL